MSFVLSERPKKVFAHYLPWYDSEGLSGFPSRTGWCLPDGSNYDCTDRAVVHYTNFPLIGEYSLHNKNVLEYHFLLMHVAGIDGIIININPTNGFQTATSLFILDTLVDLLVTWSPVIDLKVVVSYDDGGGLSTDAITPLLTWVHANIYSNPKYSSLIFIDPETMNPVIMAWSESNIAQYWTTTQALFSSSVFLIVRNPGEFENSHGNFEWVNYLNTAPPKTNSENWGRQFFQDMDWKIARQSTVFSVDPADVNTVKMGGVYPGFDDVNVPPFWNGGTNRYHLRQVDDGETMALTWDMQINYTPLRLGGTDAVENPWVQIATWNDWPEGTSVEPATDDTYGYTALETCRTKIAEFKAQTPSFDVSCLRKPFFIYEMREAGNDIEAAIAVTQLLQGDCATISTA